MRRLGTPAVLIGGKLSTLSQGAHMKRLKLLWVVGFAVLIAVGIHASAAFSEDATKKKHIVGETLLNFVGHGCANKTAAIELALWVMGKPSKIDAIMKVEFKKKAFMELFECGKIELASAKIHSLLYEAIDDDEVSFMVVKSLKSGFDYYAIVDSPVEGEPTEQDTLFADGPDGGR